MSKGSIVGREDELAILSKIVGNRDERKFGGLTLVKGSAGVGKTRLLEELTTDAARNDVTVVWGHCSEGDGVPALWPWIQLLRKLVTQSALAQLSESQPVAIQRLANHISEFNHWGVGLSGHGSVDPNTEQFLLFDAIRSVTVDLAKITPILILIEDLQWADDSSVSVLEMLLESPGPEGVELVVTVRDDALSARRYILPRTITGSVNFASINLENLNDGDSVRLFEDIVGETIDTNSRVDIWKITAGNPLFIQEYASTWKRGMTLDATAVPTSAVEAIESRLSAVPTGIREVLEYGAVIGREFDMSRLASVMAAKDAADISGALSNGIEYGFIGELVESPGWLRFTHEVIRRVIYDGLPSSRRSEIHRQIAEAFEARSNEYIAGSAAEISAHWRLAGVAGDMEQSTRWALLAGREALDSLSFDVAYDHFEYARQAAHQIGDQELEAEGNLGAGQSLAPLGREEEAIGFLRLAFDRFMESGQMDRVVQVAQIFFTGTHGQLEMAPMYERALDLVDTNSIDAARIQAPYARAVAIEMGDFKRGRALLRSAIRIARNSGDRHLESLAAGYGVQIAAFAAEWKDCIAYCERVFELQEDVDDPYSVSTAAMLLAAFRVREGRHKESDVLMARSRRSAARSGNKLRKISCDLLELRIAQARCQWDRVDRVIADSDVDSPSAERVIAITALCRHLVGDTSAGDASLLRFLELPVGTSESPDAQYFPFLARSTTNNEHIAIVKDAAAVAEKSRAEYVRRRGMIAKGWMAIEEEDASIGREVLEDLAGVELLHDEETIVPVLKYLCGEIEDAATDFEDLIDRFHTNGIFLYEAWARFDFARLLTEHREIRPEIVPQNYASEARAYAVKLGLRPLVARFDKLLASQGIVRMPFDLTRREIDVLSLVVQGSTNKEIAESLFVSPHTVNRHLGNLFGKLGVSSRAAATDMAHQNNLV